MSKKTAGQINRETIAKIICCLADDKGECGRCRKGKGCPDEWSDVAEQVDQILKLLSTNTRQQLIEEIEKIATFGKHHIAISYYDFEQFKEGIH